MLSAVMRLGEGKERQIKSKQLHEESLAIHSELMLADPSLVREVPAPVLSPEAKALKSESILSTPTRRIVENTSRVNGASPYVTVRGGAPDALNESVISFGSPVGVELTGVAEKHSR